jgi:hypothetical protein
MREFLSKINGRLVLDENFAVPLQREYDEHDLAKIDMTRYWLNKGWEATTEGEAQMVLRIESALDAIDGGAVLENQPAYLKALQSYLGGT